MAAVAAELKRARVALAQVGRRRARIDGDYGNCDLPAKLYAAQVELLDHEEQALTAATSALSAELEALTAAQADVNSREDRSVQLDSWTNLSQAEQKQILRHVVGTCIVYRAPGRDREGGTRRYLANPNPIEVDLELRRRGSQAKAPGVTSGRLRCG
jgi:hypothetical protein